MSDYPTPDMADVTLDGVLKALADPTRLAIVTLLSDGEPHAKAAVLEMFDTSKATCAHHFKALREAGLVRYEVHGRTHDMLLRSAELDARFPGLLAAVTQRTPATEV